MIRHEGPQRVRELVLWYERNDHLKAIADAIGIESLDMAEVYMKDRKTIMVRV
ncbi:MAG: hypothetical protein KKH41_02895 [Candidatus Thermoplasmatota archaeon]|nr:hypothetical protein [Candidatus Thermoplasmatota archaeon]MBU4144197.1 hypothetical protein [Candidatus Thermoplasmatota archaeon]MBU4591511.1 hypothetical protein [Candidatus Thermoplasmatota archaeon]